MLIVCIYCVNSEHIKILKFGPHDTHAFLVQEQEQSEITFTFSLHSFLSTYLILRAVENEIIARAFLLQNSSFIIAKSKTISTVEI